MAPSRLPPHPSRWAASAPGQTHTYQLHPGFPPRPAASGALQGATMELRLRFAGVMPVKRLPRQAADRALRVRRCSSSCATIALPALLGLERFVITGGSMTGTIPKGAVIYSKLTPVRAAEASGTSSPSIRREVIRWRSRTASSASSRGPTAAPSFKYQGRLQRGRRTLGTRSALKEPQSRPATSFHDPAATATLLAALARCVNVRLLLIGLPAFVIALSMLWSLWAKAGEEVARRESSEGTTGRGPARREEPRVSRPDRAASCWPR